MKIAQKFLEIESMLENILKRHTDGGLLKYKVLSYASVYENLSVSMIIEKLGIKKSNFALLASQLEKDGFVEIKHASVDRRCRSLELTEKGRNELDSFLAELEEDFGQCDIATEDAVDILNNYLNKRI